MRKYVPIRTHQRAIFVVALVATCLGPLTPALAQTATEKSSLREQYDAAQALFAQKKYEAARKLLLELWEQRKTADVASALGQVESRMGHHAEAAKYYAFASANFPPAESVKLGESLRNLLAEEKKHVITLEVTSVPEGASVFVDGVEAGTTPLATPLFMEPGMHIVAVKKQGYKLIDRSIRATAGAFESWEAKLVPVESAPSPAVTPSRSPVFVSPPPELPPPSKPNPWILVGGGVVTVGAFVTGLVFHGKANEALDRVNELRAQTDSFGCYEGGTATASLCADLRDEGKRKDNARNLSTGAFIVGGAAALGTALYWFWPRRSAQAVSSTFRVNGLATSSGAALTISGRF